jgi:hypothetical protein
MCELCEQQAAQPVNVIASNLDVLYGLRLGDSRDGDTRRDAVRAVRTQVRRLDDERSDAVARADRAEAELARVNRRNERLSEQLRDERKARQTAEIVASNTHSMSSVVRDLTKVFPDAELDFQQVDENGYEYVVVGYEALELKVNYYNSTVTVRNTTKRRKARTIGVDLYYGLSADVFVAIEALFADVELSKSNTPRRVHDEMFEDEPEPTNPLAAMFGPSCGNPDCPLHGDDAEVPDFIKALAGALGADGIVVMGGPGSPFDVV